MFSCPCQKRADKKAHLTRAELAQAFVQKRIVKGKTIKVIGGSGFGATATAGTNGTTFTDLWTAMPGAIMQSLLPANMVLGELAGSAYYSAPKQILDIVPPSQSPAPNPPLIGTGLVWKWPADVFGKKASLFILGKCDKLPASWGDVNEGSLGDCWLMAGIAAVARYGIAASLFTNVDGPNPANLTVTLCQQNGPYGSFQTQFPITITTQIPVDTDNNLVYVKSDSFGEYWPCLLEKAVACVLYRNGVNGYSSIVGGYTNCGIGLFVPGYALQVWFNTDADENVTSSVTDVQNAWTKLMQNGNTVDVSFISSSNTLLPDGQYPGFKGLLAKHAYSIFALITAPLGTAPPTTTTPTVTLALLRNPYGHGTTCATPNGGEWSGTWSDCDTVSWNANPWVAAATGYNGKVKNDGMFWMEISDIMTYSSGYYGIFMPTNPTLQAMDLTQLPVGLPGAAVPVAQSTTCQPVQFNIATKKNAQYIGWNVPDTSYFSPAGVYSNNDKYTTNACLEPGTYTFVATNTIGTGWSKNNTFSIVVDGQVAIPPTTPSSQPESTPFTVP